MKRKRLVKVVILLLGLLLCWGLVWSWHITRTVSKNNKDSVLKNQHAVVKNIIVTETHEEKKYWEFYAKSGEYNSEHNAIALNDIIGNFYDKDQEVQLSFKANRGKYDEKTKKVILNGDNLIVSKDASQLYADELIWQGRDKDILANGNVQFIQPNKLVIKAKRAEFNTSLTRFRVLDSTITKVYTDNESDKKYTLL